MPETAEMSYLWVEHAITLAHRMANAKSDLDRLPNAARANEWAYRVKELRAHLKTPKHELPPQQREDSGCVI